MNIKNIAIFLLILFISITSNKTYAQKQNNQWRFGSGGGINFNTIPPGDVSGAAIATAEGSASVADRTTGALLFYTDGVRVWNANNQVMPNGNGLSGGTPALLSSTTAAVIIPKPGSSNLYYIVTVDEQSSNNGVRYSVVDMNLNGGLGDILAGQKNIFLLQTPSEKLEVVPASDGESLWLLAHDGSNSYYSFKVNSAGIQSTPVISANLGSIQGNDAGHFKINKQFNKLAMGNLTLGSGSASTVELFDFDNATGIFSNPTILKYNFGVEQIYGVEFSPNGKVLYVSGLQSRLIQYDLTQPTAVAIENSAYQVSTGPVATLQLGVDDKIYVNAGSINAINCPDQLGPACDYQTSVIAGQTRGGGYGLPKWVYYPTDTAALYLNSITYSDSCLGNAILFSVRNTAGISKITWNFGDPASGTSNTATGFSANHTFSQTGNFTIQAILTNACGFDTLFINSLSIINCKSSCTGSISSKDTCVLNGTSFQVISNNTINSVSWNFDDPSSGTDNTSTSLTPTHLFSSAGTFNIRSIINFSCGIDTVFKTISIINCDSIQEDCQIFFPNAFTPNGDGDNDHFNPLTICTLEHYECLVFSRWGELIFQTFNQNEKWDGSYNGIDCSTGIYIYLVKYKLPRQPFKNINGTITLLR